MQQCVKKFKWCECFGNALWANINMKVFLHHRWLHINILFFFMLHCNNHSCKDPTFSPPLFVIKASNSLWSPASTAAEYFIGIKSSNSSNITVFCWINNADAAMARSAFDGLCSSGMRWMDLAGFLEGWRWQNPPDNVQLSASNASLRLTKRFPDYILFFLFFFNVFPKTKSA